MADLLHKQKVPLETKLIAARELAQYLEPKLRSTELTGDEHSPLRLLIETVSYADPDSETAP